MSNNTISIADLRAAGCCKHAVGKFIRLFGDSTEVTVEKCVQHAGVFQFDFAAEKLLNARGARLFFSWTNDDYHKWVNCSTATREDREECERLACSWRRKDAESFARLWANPNFRRNPSSEPADDELLFERNQGVAYVD